MSKPKRGTALFDLLREEEAKGSKPLAVPKWWERGGNRPERSARADSSPPHYGAGHAPLKPAVEAASFRMPDSSAGKRSGTDRFVELDGDRIKVSFTSGTAAVTVFAFLVIILGALEIGRNLGYQAGFVRGVAAGRAAYEADALSEIEAARRQPPATQVVRNLLVEPDAVMAREEAGDSQTGTDRERPKWIRDYTYVVAQEFAPGHETSARQAQAFLKQHGVTTELVEYPSGSIQLITVKGYDRHDPTQRRMADQLLEKVRAIGARYFAEGGGYRLEGYFKTLKKESW